MYYLYGEDPEEEQLADDNIEAEAASDASEYPYLLEFPIRVPCAAHMVQNWLRVVLKKQGHLNAMVGIVGLIHASDIIRYRCEKRVRYPRAR